MELEKTSKFLSYVLRHRPDSIGLTLDENGWADVDALIACAAQNGTVLTHALIRELVISNDKQRFALDETPGRIRANQGHSVAVDLGLQPITPPDTLYHGTATRFVESIRVEGLLPRSRQHVHLSATVDTARNVGARHGVVIILPVRAAALAETGIHFYRSENGVWLADHIPAAFIDFADAIA
ncbi:RNA 2'-phosphotransferase [Andreprevotia sp. IGB-42]|uniref:RNA 2'-phosphotransferase n=1 Tax=Andreprevotia sp. IGB-42 TaxID=2497473 RepID=UPI00157EF6AD|nr:RNA 2'-phosphotransferase [Andreprevotia sp. IGB-42]KAF0811600.1 RNA 2'-phosphotransferase [Andreprevotia sp. IGB-42]